MIPAASEQQRMLGQALERYLRNAYSLAQRAALQGSEAGFGREHWSFFSELGLLGLPFAEADGGFGGSLADVMAVMQQMGQGLVLEPYVDCVLLAGRLLTESRDATQKAGRLQRLIAGEALFALAHAERGDYGGCAVHDTVLRRSERGLRLDGGKILVAAPVALEAMLVSARDENGELRICLVGPEDPGVSVRPYRTVDGHAVGEVRFDDVAIGADALLALEDAGDSLRRVMDYASAALCAEALGCMSSLFTLTSDYCQTRQQFGRPIGSFQVLKHRLVDCYTSLRQAQCLLDSLQRESASGWSLNLAAAMAFIADHALRIGHEAIQMHGGMGLTDELAVSHYHKRLLAISQLLGGRLALDQRFVETRAVLDPDRSTVLPLDDLPGAAQRAFRDEVRDFLRDNLDKEISRAVRLQTGSYPERDLMVEWQRRLNARGWLAPHWPVEFGGTGWAPLERFVFEYECAVAGAPEQVPMGYRYVGPVIAHFGSEWQKSFFLPKLLSSEHYWAQGFSEPGAGSDLAAIRTSAVLDGDHYVVNGSKMWTTHAHYANWIFCIVRTEKCERPQDGISFLLIELDRPGISIEPIPLLALDHEVNQVFFDDVRVPATQLVGEPGRGWEYTKFLLEFERGGVVFSGRLRYEFERLRELCAASAPQLLQDRVFLHRLAALEYRLMALEAMEFGLAATPSGDGAPGVSGSVTKLLSSELQKDITECAAQVAGLAGLEVVPWRPLATAPESLPGFDLESVAVPRYLNMRVASIYGGSSEVQREIIARHVLGMK